MKQKVFISGRVSGLKPDTVRKNFSKVESKYKKLGYDVINPTKLCSRDWCWIRCMYVCLRALYQCDFVYMIPNWKKSRGARIEHWFARIWGKGIYYGERV